MRRPMSISQVEVLSFVGRRMLLNHLVIMYQSITSRSHIIRRPMKVGLLGYFVGRLGVLDL